MAIKQITLGGLIFTLQDANTLGVEIIKEGFRKSQPDHEQWDTDSLILSAWSSLVVCVAYTLEIGYTDAVTPDEMALVDFWKHESVSRRDYMWMWSEAQKMLQPEHLNLWFKAYIDTRPHAIIAPDTLKKSQQEASAEGEDFLAPTELTVPTT